MTSDQDVSEYLDTLGLVKSYFFKFFFYSKIKKIENFFLWCSADAQRMRRFACFQDCLLILTCHLAEWTTLIIVYKWLLKLIHFRKTRGKGLSVMSGLASNPANRQIASSSGRRRSTTKKNSRFFCFFFPKKT